MIKLFIDKDAYGYLNEWSDSARTKTKYCPAYDRRAQVLLTTPPWHTLTLYVDETRYGYKFALNALDGDESFDKGVIVKGKLLHLPESERDFDVELGFCRDFSDEEKNRAAYATQLFCTAFVEANCFMWYGTLAESKEYTAAGANDGSAKVITFRKFKDTIYAVPVGHHRSPEGVFQVRGHFRQYQSGKVVWIDPYLKGL